MTMHVLDIGWINNLPGHVFAICHVDMVTIFIIHEHTIIERIEFHNVGLISIILVAIVLILFVNQDAILSLIELCSLGRACVKSLLTHKERASLH